MGRKWTLPPFFTPFSVNTCAITVALTAMASLLCTPAVAVEKNAPPPPNPYCVGPDVPESCSWSRKKLQALEREIVAQASRRFKTVVLDHLQWAVWQPPNGRLTDEDRDRSEQYCRKVLSALRTGRYTLFPEPQAKSSDIGIQALSKSWLDSTPQDKDCQQEREIAATMTEGKPLDKRYPFTDRSMWLYTSSKGHVVVDFTLSSGDMWVGATTDRCRRDEAGSFSSSFQDEYGQRGGVGSSFSELGFAVVEIDGRLYVAGGGKLWMDGPYYVWRENVYSSLRGGYMEWLEERGREWPRWPDGERPSKEQIRDLQGRVLAVYPLDIRWLTGDSSEPTIPGMTHGPCLWNLEE